MASRRSTTELLPLVETYTHVTTCPHPLLSRHTSGREPALPLFGGTGSARTPGPFCGLDASSRLHLTLGLIFLSARVATPDGFHLEPLRGIHLAIRCTVTLTPTGATCPTRFILTGFLLPQIPDVSFFTAEEEGFEPPEAVTPQRFSKLLAKQLRLSHSHTFTASGRGCIVCTHFC